MLAKWDENIPFPCVGSVGWGEETKTVSSRRHCLVLYEFIIHLIIRLIRQITNIGTICSPFQGLSGIVLRCLCLSRAQTVLYNHITTEHHRGSKCSYNPSLLWGRLSMYFFPTLSKSQLFIVTGDGRTWLSWEG